jgi:Cu+-exporting ATPase
VVEYARQQGVEPVAPSEFKAEPGRGIAAEVAGHRLLLGSAAWLVQQGVVCDELAEAATALAAEGKSPVYLAIDGQAGALFAIADKPKPQARAGVAALLDQRIEVLMLTGDNRNTAESIAQALGITQVVAEATPLEKLDCIKGLQAEGKRVGMVGDGVNDAPALAAADVGFAVGTGTDVAIEAADITLVSHDFTRVAEAVALSHNTMKVIKQNLFWALAYNSIAIPVAISGRLTPMVASAAMAMSSVSVITNSLRLQRMNLRATTETK